MVWLRKSPVTICESQITIHKKNYCAYLFISIHIYSYFIMVNLLENNIVDREREERKRVIEGWKVRKCESEK